MHRGFQIPDAVSLVRAVLSPFLLILEPLSISYLAVYVLCCMSDVLDGYIARRLDRCTLHGEKLDSICDVVFVLCLIISLTPVIPWEPWFLVWVAVIAVVRISAFTIASYRQSDAVFLHTYANKAAGAALCISVFLLPVVDFVFVAVPVLLVTSYAAAEYLWLCLAYSD